MEFAVLISLLGLLLAVPSAIHAILQIADRRRRGKFGPTPSSNPPPGRFGQYSSFPTNQAAILPQKRRRNGFWWSLWFGGITGILAYIMMIWRLAGWASVIVIFLVILAGFLAGRMVLRKWAGTLAGGIAGITLVVLSYLASPTAKLPTGSIFDILSSYLYVFGVLAAMGMLLGFLGALLGTIGISSTGQ